jgi:glycosyltransferase involved in cell wall biosynthesis
VEEPGISAARNAILDEARRRRVDFLAMIDDDEEADPDWLRELLKMQQNAHADVVGGPVDSVLSHSTPPAIANCDAFRRPPRPAGPVPMIDATGNVLLSCAALDRNGWPSFDSAFGLTGGEDKDFFTRLKKRNASFAWAPMARAREHVPADRANGKWLLRRAYRIGNSDMRIIRLHGGNGAVLASLGKALLLLGSAPLGLPLLAIPSRRLWLMRKWSRSAGKLAALFGSDYREYGRSGWNSGE